VEAGRADVGHMLLEAEVSRKKSPQALKHLQFLPRDAMRKRCLAVGAVSVRLSV